jgi:transmembrane sensor
VNVDARKAHPDELLAQAHELLAALPRSHADPLQAPAVQAFMARSQAHRETMYKLATMWTAFGSIRELPWPSADELAGDLDNGKEREAVTSKRSPWPMLRMAAVIAMAVIGVAVWMIQPRMLDEVTPEFQTAIAQSQTFTLADGSQMHLGAATKVTAEISEDGRNILLERGQALFDVRKDPQRPFRVRVGAATVVAVGTAFDVRRYDHHAVVSITEGVVTVTAGGSQPKTLNAGQQITIGDDNTFSAVRARPVEQMLAWRDGRFAYVAEPLRDVISDVSRYSRKRIHLVEDVGATMEYTGVVDQDDIDDWLQGLPSVFDLHIVERDERIDIQRRDAR